MAELIKHSGVVIATDGDWVEVKTIKSSACAACAAKQMCNSSESQEITLRAYADAPLSAGDKVEVTITQQAGWKAISIAYLAPLVLLALVICILTALHLSDAVIGAVSVGILAVYYLVLATQRKHLEGQFSIHASKNEYIN